MHVGAIVTPFFPTLRENMEAAQDTGNKHPVAAI